MPDTRDLLELLKAIKDVLDGWELEQVSMMVKTLEDPRYARNFEHN